MMRAVLDTNVVVSAHLKSDGREALILELAIAGRFHWYASEELIAEFGEVLQRAKFGLNSVRLRQWLKEMRKHVRVVKPSVKVDSTRDASDNKLLECALEAKAQYVVTGNVKHFPNRYRSARVVTPREFMMILTTEP